jgi:hypothetical protein
MFRQAVHAILHNSTKYTVLGHRHIARTRPANYRVTNQISQLWNSEVHFLYLRSNSGSISKKMYRISSTARNTFNTTSVLQSTKTFLLGLCNNAQQHRCAEEKYVVRFLWSEGVKISEIYGRMTQSDDILLNGSGGRPGRPSIIKYIAVKWCRLTRCQRQPEKKYIYSEINISSCRIESSEKCFLNDAVSCWDSIHSVGGRWTEY